MDPFSIAASTIAVIQISSKIIAICYNYRAGVKSAPKDLISLTRELQDFQTVLEQLQSLAEGLEYPDSQDKTHLKSLELLSGPDGPLPEWQAELEALEAKLKPKDGIKAVGQALLWPLKENYVQKILARVGSFKALLNLALSTDQT
jgi:hypothetical protein